MHEQEETQEHLLSYRVYSSDAEDVLAVARTYHFRAQKQRKKKRTFKNAHQSEESAKAAMALWNQISDQELRQGEFGELEMTLEQVAILIEARMKAKEQRKKEIRRYERMLRSGPIGRLSLALYSVGQPDKSPEHMRGIVRRNLAAIEPLETSVMRDLDRLPMTDERG